MDTKQPALAAGSRRRHCNRLAGLPAKPASGAGEAAAGQLAIDDKSASTGSSGSSGSGSGEEDKEGGGTSAEPRQPQQLVGAPCALGGNINRARPQLPGSGAATGCGMCPIAVTAAQPQPAAASQQPLMPLGSGGIDVAPAVQLIEPDAAAYSAALNAALDAPPSESAPQHVHESYVTRMRAVEAVLHTQVCCCLSAGIACSSLHACLTLTVHVFLTLPMHARKTH